MENTGISKESAYIGKEFNFSTNTSDKAVKDAISRICSNSDELTHTEFVESPVIKTYDMDLKIQISISLREDGSYDVFCSGPSTESPLSKEDTEVLNSMGVAPMNISSYVKIHPPTGEQKVSDAFTANVDEDSLHYIVCDWLFSHLDAYQNRTANKTSSIGVG